MRGEWHEYLACYERIQRGGGKASHPERGEMTVKARNDREACEKAVHLLRAAGVRYKFKLSIKRAGREGNGVEQ